MQGLNEDVSKIPIFMKGRSKIMKPIETHFKALSQNKKTFRKKL